MPFFKISLLKAILVEIHSESKQQVIFLQLLQRNHHLACILSIICKQLWKKDMAVVSSWQGLQCEIHFRLKKMKIWKRMSTKAHDSESCINGEKCCFAYCNIKNLYVKVKSNNVTLFWIQMLLLCSPISYEQRKGGI